MDIYTLDENFLRQDVVDEFHSVVWTERYTKAGDVNLVVPINAKNVAMEPHYGFWRFLLDCFLVLVTGGLWLIWIFVREMRRERRYRRYYHRWYEW